MHRRHDYAAEGDLRERVRSAPARPGAYRRLAAWLSRAGRFSQARAVLQDGIAKADRAASLEHLLGLILARTGDYAGAARHLARAAARAPTDFVCQRDLALARAALGKVAESVAGLREATALAGAGPSGLEWILQAGERALTAAGLPPPRRPPPRSGRAAAVETHVARDPALVEALLPRRGEPAGADRETLVAVRRALRRLAAAHPAYADLHFGLGLAAEQLGELDRAVAAAEKALAINPRYAEAALLAVRLYEKRGDRARAQERCRLAAGLRPDWMDTHMCLGRLLREQGRTEEANEAYRRALEASPACARIRRDLEALAAGLGGEGGAA